MKTKRLFIILFAAMIFVLAQKSASAADTKYAGSFLELGVGARAMGMGGAYVALANDGSAFYWNPAGVATMQQMEVSGMYASLFKSLEKHHYIGFTKPLYGGAALAMNWIRLSVADIPHYESDNLRRYGPNGYGQRIDESTKVGTWQELQELGTVLTDAPLGYSSFVNDAFFLTLAKQYSMNVDFGWQYFVLPIEIPVGINLKYIRQSLFNKSASGLGLDLGGMLKFGLNDLFDDNRLGKISMAAALKDAWNTKITWNTDSRHEDRIKHTWLLGGAYFQPLTKIHGELYLSYMWEYKYSRVHHMGVEYVYFNRLAIRFGLDNNQFTAGVGIKVMGLRLDYAYKGHELGGSHRIGTSLRF